jgi:DNA mismatch repair ATPase MutS
MELEETKYIMDRATQNSLVIMDELGRGTSTFDGYSLAYSVLKYVHQKNKSRLLFTTHYHWLVDDFRHFDALKLYTMLIDQNEENREFCEEGVVQVEK